MGMSLSIGGGTASAVQTPATPAPSAPPFAAPPAAPPGGAAQAAVAGATAPSPPPAVAGVIAGGPPPATQALITQLTALLTQLQQLLASNTASGGGGAPGQSPVQQSPTQAPAGPVPAPAPTTGGGPAGAPTLTQDLAAGYINPSSTTVIMQSVGMTGAAFMMGADGNPRIARGAFMAPAADSAEWKPLNIPAGQEQTWQLGEGSSVTVRHEYRPEWGQPHGLVITSNDPGVSSVMTTWDNPNRPDPPRTQVGSGVAKAWSALLDTLLGPRT